MNIDAWSTDNSFGYHHRDEVWYDRMSYKNPLTDTNMNNLDNYNTGHMTGAGQYGMMHSHMMAQAQNKRFPPANNMPISNAMSYRDNTRGGHGMGDMRRGRAHSPVNHQYYHGNMRSQAPPMHAPPQMADDREFADSPPDQYGYGDDRIKNDLLDEICSDIGINDAMDLDFLDFDHPGSYMFSGSRVPSDIDISNMDQTIPFSEYNMENNYMDGGNNQRFKSHQQSLPQTDSVCTKLPPPQSGCGDTQFTQVDSPYSHSVPSVTSVKSETITENVDSPTVTSSSQSNGEPCNRASSAPVSSMSGSLGSPTVHSTTNSNVDLLRGPGSVGSVDASEPSPQPVTQSCAPHHRQDSVDSTASCPASIPGSHGMHQTRASSVDSSRASPKPSASHDIIKHVKTVDTGHRRGSVENIVPTSTVDTKEGIKKNTDAYISHSQPASPAKSKFCNANLMKSSSYSENLHKESLKKLHQESSGYKYTPGERPNINFVSMPSGSITFTGTTTTSVDAKFKVPQGPVPGGYHDRKSESPFDKDHPSVGTGSGEYNSPLPASQESPHDKVIKYLAKSESSSDAPPMQNFQLSSLPSTADLNIPALQGDGMSSGASSQPDSPSAMHVAKRARIISSGSDLLEEMRERYSFVKGADMFAPPSARASPMGSPMSQRGGSNHMAQMGGGGGIMPSMPGGRQNFRLGAPTHDGDMNRGGGMNKQFTFPSQAAMRHPGMPQQMPQNNMSGDMQNAYHDQNSAYNRQMPGNPGAYNNQDFGAGSSHYHRPMSQQIMESNMCDTSKQNLLYNQGMRPPSGQNMMQNNSQYMQNKGSNRPMYPPNQWGQNQSNFSNNLESSQMNMPPDLQTPHTSPLKPHRQPGVYNTPQHEQTFNNQYQNRPRFSNMGPQMQGGPDNGQFNNYRPSHGGPGGPQGPGGYPSQQQMSNNPNQSMMQQQPPQNVGPNMNINPQQMQNMNPQQIPQQNNSQMMGPPQNIRMGPPNTGNPMTPVQNIGPNMGSTQGGPNMGPTQGGPNMGPTGPPIAPSVSSGYGSESAVTNPGMSGDSAIPDGLKPGNPMTSQGLMQSIITDSSSAFRSHPLFPLLRDLIIADMNFHSPTFPFQLIANLPQDFDKLLQNYLNRNPPSRNHQPNPGVEGVIMDALKYAHQSLIDKIQRKKQEVGYQETAKPLSAIEDFCERFDRAVKNTMSSDGASPGPTNILGKGIHKSLSSAASTSKSQSLPSTPSKSKSADSRTDTGKSKVETTTTGHAGRNKVLPKESVAIMMDWLREHQDNPYPNDDEKEMLIQKTKLTINQINYWFTNARRRILPKWALQRYMEQQQNSPFGPRIS